MPGKITRHFELIITALVCLAAWTPLRAEAGRYKDFNLLIISVTNLGTQHMGLYGYSRATTPNLYKWAADALIFEDAFTQAPWTLPVATSLFTGLYPNTHKVLERDRNNTLARDIRTLPELLVAAGYRTAAFTGGLDQMKQAGHMRGFATAADNPPFTGFAATTAQAADWLAKNSGGKFFLFVHGYDAHPPFVPSQRFGGVFASTEGKHVAVDPSFTYRGYLEPGSRGMTAHYHIPGPGPAKGKKAPPRGKAVLKPDDIAYLRDLYDEKLLDADLQIGNFLDSLEKELLARTIVIVLSEHGEMFAEHGRLGRGGAHRGTLYDEVAHVPLIIRLPGAGEKRIKGLVQLIDLLPTLAELLEVPAPAKIQGVSLLPLINEGRPVNKFAFAGTTYDPYKPGANAPYGVASLTESVRDGKWKLMHEVTVPEKPRSKSTETFELYDMENDPGEKTDAAASHPEIVKELSLELRRWNGSSRKFLKTAPATRKVPEAVLEKARQRGYW